MQSCGSSGTVALASAVAADIIIPAERGAYMGIASLGNILAPSLGPIAGGLLSQYLGWQAVFWFLTILASAFFLPFLLFFPETCRAIVDDGTLAVSRWNRPRWKLVSSRRSRSIGGNDPEISTNSYRSSQAWKIPNPWSSLRLLFRRPIGLVLLANGVIFGGYYAVTAGIPGQLGELYQLNDLWIGFCFIPAGLASLLSATLNGFLVDWNYRRMNKQTGESSTGNPKHNNNNFPVERARLQICIPMTVSSFISPFFSTEKWPTLLTLPSVLCCTECGRLWNTYSWKMSAVDRFVDDICYMFLSDGLVQRHECASRRFVLLYSCHGDGS